MKGFLVVLLLAIASLTSSCAIAPSEVSAQSVKKDHVYKTLKWDGNDRSLNAAAVGGWHLHTLLMGGDATYAIFEQ